MTSLAEISARFADDLEHLYDDAAATAYQEFEDRLPDCDEAELTEALEIIATRLETVSLGAGQQLAYMAGSLVEHGAAAAHLMRAIEPRVVDGLSRAAEFPLAWELASYGTDLPDPEDDEVVVEDIRDQMMRNLKRARLTEEEADDYTEAWFSVGGWMQALMAAAQPADGRRAMTSKDELTEALAPIGEYYSATYWLDGLLNVLDDTPLVVLHRESGHGYRMTIGGIGDNYQLQTLLAARLIGDPGAGLIYAVAPKPEWVAAAESGEDLEPEGGIRAQFTLVDAYGEWIPNGARPVDIPDLDGVRVVVLDPLPQPDSWSAGRIYLYMEPTVRLDAVMPADEAAHWLARVAPAVGRPID